MKIAVVDNLSDGGAKRVVFEQVKGLAKCHSVYYFTHADKTLFDLSDSATVTTFPISLELKKGLMRPFSEFTRLLRLIRWYEDINVKLEQLQPDVVLIHPDRITQAPFLLYLIKFPCIYYMHEWNRLVYEPALHPLPKEFPKRFFEISRRFVYQQLDYWATRKASVLAANSHFTQNNIMKAYGQKSVVIYPGVDVSIFKPKKQIKKEHYLFIGSKDELNGYPLLERAIAKATLPYKIKLAYFKQEKTLTDHEIAELYQKAAATLCISPNEPFGLPSIESMACGTPVIAINSGGYPETVIDGKTGFLIEQNEELLLEKMKFISTNKEVLESMTAACIKRAAEFNWIKHLEKLEQLFTELL